MEINYNATKTYVKISYTEDLNSKGVNLLDSKNNRLWAGGKRNVD